MAPSNDSTLDLRVRYYQDETEPGEPVHESNFVRAEMPIALPCSQTALVLVDVWHRFRRASYETRARDVIVNRLLPAIGAVRTAGLSVIHAPGPVIAASYRERESKFVSTPDDATADRTVPNVPTVPKRRATTDAATRSAADDEWPPERFRAREGEYAEYRGSMKRLPPAETDGLVPEISRLLEVETGDRIVGSGEELHAVLAESRILHLVYAGFAANWCVMSRDYGIRAMAKRGYNIVLLRDCTAGVEYQDTLETGLAMEMTIREVEDRYGFTASTDDFLFGLSRIH